MFEAEAAAQGHSLALTRTAHIVLIIAIQVLAAVGIGVVLLIASDAGDTPWWHYVTPNGVALVVTFLAPLPYRVDRSKRSARQ